MKTSALGISKIAGEGGHDVGKNGEKWIFSPKIIFFVFRKKKLKIFDDQIAHIWVKFGSIWAKMGHF